MGQNRMGIRETLIKAFPAPDQQKPLQIRAHPPEALRKR